MLCPLCNVEVPTGEENCLECGTYIELYNSVETYEGGEAAVVERETDGYDQVDRTVAPEQSVTEESVVTEQDGGDTSDGDVEDLQSEIIVVKKKMKKAKHYYRHKKISKEKYVRLMKGYKKKLKRYRDMVTAREAAEEPAFEEAPVEEAPAEEVPREIARPQAEHRSQLTFEDLYSPITDDESWADPLLVTEFATATRECPNCNEDVRTHWIVCPSCQGEL